MSSVDVIVPCYRYGHFLRECVESVLTQQGPSVRVLVIDDASPDQTSEVAAGLAKRESRVTLIRHVINKGHIASYNEGIEWASADYMLILSADDYLLPGALQRAANLMDTHSEVGFTFGSVIELRDNQETARSGIEIGSEEYRILGGTEFIEFSGSGNMVKTPSAVVRTELQKRVGPYRPELPHAGDMEMWLRFAALGSVGIINADQAVYRRHSSNMSLQYTAQHWLQDLQQRGAAFESFFQTCGTVLPNVERLRRHLLWLLSCEAIGFAGMAFNEGETEISEQLREFALSASPNVKTSLPWLKLACKRGLGLRAWRTLRPSLTRVRKAVSR